MIRRRRPRGVAKTAAKTSTSTGTFELAAPPQEAGLSAGKLEMFRLKAVSMLRGSIDTEGLDDDSVLSLARLCTESGHEPDGRSLLGLNQELALNVEQELLGLGDDPGCARLTVFVEKHAPELAVCCPPCATLRSSTSTCTTGTSSSLAQHVAVCWQQLEKQRHFVMELPENDVAWRGPELCALLKDGRTHAATGAACAWRFPGGDFRQQRPRWLTTAGDLAEILRQAAPIERQVLDDGSAAMPADVVLDAVLATRRQSRANPACQLELCTAGEVPDDGDYATRSGGDWGSGAQATGEDVIDPTLLAKGRSPKKWRGSRSNAFSRRLPARSARSTKAVRTP